MNTVHGCTYTCCYIFVFDKKNIDCTTALCLLCFFILVASSSQTVKSNTECKVFWCFMLSKILKITITFSIYSKSHGKTNRLYSSCRCIKTQTLNLQVNTSDLEVHHSAMRHLLFTFANAKMMVSFLWYLALLYIDLGRWQWGKGKFIDSFIDHQSHQNICSLQLSAASHSDMPISLHFLALFGPSHFPSGSWQVHVVRPIRSSDCKLL